MKVKKFVANNMQEAMWMVKADLGKDALILHTRKFKRGGILGLFGKDMVEVTAAAATELVNTGSERRVNPYSQFSQAQIISQNFEQQEKYEALKKELDEVKLLLTRLASSNREKFFDQSRPLEETKTAYYILTEIYELLLQNDVEKSLIEELTQKVINKLDSKDLQDTYLVKETFLKEISDSLGKPQLIDYNNARNNKILSFIGPTGVGKTTTIAKLAAKFSLIDKKSVALVTADTYRISAVSQLKKYAEIIDVPLAVAYSPLEMNSILRQVQDKDIVLIDTAGRSPNNIGQMNELNDYMNVNFPMTTFLVLSATTKYSDLLQLYERFKPAGVDSLIFTKLDETLNHGNILNMRLKTGCPLSYITNGQNVPDDIEVADPMKIAKLVLRES